LGQPLKTRDVNDEFELSEQIAMDMRQLRFFVGIVEAGSIAKAANRLFVAQTSLSEHVKALEEITDTKLLHRHARGVRCTEAGEKFYRHCVTMLRIYQTMLDDVKTSAGEIKGRVAIGLPNTVSEMLSVPVLSAVVSQFPQIKLALAQSVSENLQRWLEDGKLSLAVLFMSEASTGQRVDVSHLVDESMFVVAPGRNVDRKSAAKLADFQGQKLFCPGPDQGLTKLIQAYAAAQGIGLNIAAEVDSLQAMIGATDANLGYAVLPGSASRLVATFPNLVMVPLAPELMRPLALCSPKLEHSSPAVDAVRGVLLTIVQTLVKTRQWTGARLTRN
jgi:LysR family nitrogen assimilation transcriptional regulator